MSKDISNTDRERRRRMERARRHASDGQDTQSALPRNISNKGGGAGTYAKEDLASGGAGHLTELSLRPPSTTASGFILPEEALKDAAIVSHSVIGDVGVFLAAVRAYKNYQYIANAKDFLSATVDDILTNEIEAERFASLPREISTQKAIENIARRKMLGELTQNTLTPGFAVTALITSTFVSLSALVPPLAAPLFLAGMVVLSVGTIATGIAAITNRAILNRKLRELINNDKEVQNKIKTKTHSVSKDPLYQDFEQNKLMGNFLQRFNYRIINFLTLAKATSVFSFLASTIHTITGTFQNMAVMIYTLLDGAKNHFNRQAKLNKFSIVLKETFIPKLHTKPFVFFGKTNFEKYVIANQKSIAKKLHLKENISFKELMYQLKYVDRYKNEYKALQEDCVKENIRDKFAKFCTKRKIDTHNPKNFELFMRDEIRKTVGRDVAFSGYMGSFSVGMGFLSLGALFPPLGIVGAALGAATLIVGGIVTTIVKKLEVTKFDNKFTEVLATDPKDHSTAASKANAEARQLFDALCSIATNKASSRNPSKREASHEEGRDKGTSKEVSRDFTRKIAERRRSSTHTTKL
jgi:hypothetical protein